MALMQTKSVLVIFLLTCAGLVVAKQTSDEQAIRDADDRMVAALNARDVERWLTYFSDDAAMWPHCEPRVVGKEAIREYIQQYVALPSFSVSHHIETVVVAESGDLAYLTYTYEMGNPVAERGKDLTVYGKGDDGTWKVVIDMWSTDTAPCH